MNPADITEEIPHEEIKPVIDAGTPDITDILDEDVKKEEVNENTEIKKDDFTDVDFEEGDPAPVDPKKNAKILTLEKVEEKKPEPVNENKQGAVARLFKASTVMLFYNAVAGRVGSMANKNNPDCLKFNRQDTDDIGILMEETVKEENWSGFPTKWLLLIIVGLILVGKIFSWKKKPADPNQVALDQSKQLQEQTVMITQLQENLKAMQDQNKLLLEIVHTNKGKSPKEKEPVAMVKAKKIYKGFDLSKRDLFTEKGAMIFPEMAGQHGYSKIGAKSGVPSNEEKDIWEKWKQYQEQMELVEDFEEAM